MVLGVRGALAFASGAIRSYWSSLWRAAWQDLALTTGSCWVGVHFVLSPHFMDTRHVGILEGMWAGDSGLLLTCV